MIGLYNYSVWFTFLGTCCGMLSILFSTSHNPFYAVIFLMLAGFFDMFDGTVAKSRKNRSEFDKNYGIQLDSLSDAICFGAAPVFLTLEVLKDLPYLKYLSVFYLITSISRLAYFNVEEAIRRTKETESRKTYTGLPVTATSLILPVAYAFKPVIPNYFPYIFLVVLGLISILQISKLKIPHLQWKGLLICLLFGSLVFGILTWCK